ncbi:unnamed protein product, partial (mitochondrion) [Musa textilis]
VRARNVLSYIEFKLCQEITRKRCYWSFFRRNFTSQLIGSLLTHWLDAESNTRADIRLRKEMGRLHASYTARYQPSSN